MSTQAAVINFMASCIMAAVLAIAAIVLLRAATLPPSPIVTVIPPDSPGFAVTEEDCERGIYARCRVLADGSIETTTSPSKTRKSNVRS